MNTYLARQLVTFTKKGYNTFLTSQSEEQKALVKYVLNQNTSSDDDDDHTNTNTNNSDMDKVSENEKDNKLTKPYIYKTRTSTNAQLECCIMEYKNVSEKIEKGNYGCYCYSK